MKHIVFICSFFIFSPALAQQPLSRAIFLDSIYNRYINEEARYVCSKDSLKKDPEGLKVRAINSASFDSLFKVIVSRVVVNSEDLVRNGKAVNVSFTELTKKISINYNLEQPKTSERYWNFGFNAENASKNFFEFLGKDGYKQGWGISVGRTEPLKKRSIFFKESTCSTLQVNRKKHFIELLTRYDSVLRVPDDVIADLRTRTTLFENRTLGANSAAVLSGSNLSFANEADYKKAKELLKRRDSLDKKMRPDAKGVYAFDKVYTPDLVAFERANFKDYGFSIHWFNFGGGLDFKTFSIYDTATVRIIEPDKKETWRLRGFVNYNYMRETAGKHLLYASLGVEGGNTDFLEELLPSDISILKQGNVDPGIDIKEDYSVLVLRDYNRLKKNYGYIAPSVTLNYFFGPKRFFGLELQSSARLRFAEPEDVKVLDTYTVKGGVLFSFEGKDKLAKSTFGFIGSFNNIPFKKGSIKDRSNIGIRIGVPFNF